ncbi:MAG: hypothetical protein MN733_22010 [Nitrososphaera sp.]|nr:hypothetical protein [Nitrososphaera sp.]
MRISHTPNLRVQDGTKRELLCWDCEQLFAGWEKTFADTIFYPYQKESSVPLRYTQFLLKFATSLSWRVLLHHIEEAQLDHYTAEQLAQATTVGETWREFLRGDRDNPACYEQHVLPLDLIESYETGRIPPGINFYFMCTVDFDCVAGKNSAFVFTKIPGFVFIGFLIRPARKDWSGTKINLKTGVFKPGCFTIPKGLWEYFSERSSEVLKVHDQISEKQSKKVAEAFDITSEKLLKSRTIKAMYQDYKLSGGKVFVTKDDE